MKTPKNLHRLINGTEISNKTEKTSNDQNFAILDVSINLFRHFW